MAKIGRNEACPCGSGRKYKRCCLKSHAESESPTTPTSAPKISIGAEVATLQEAAANRQDTLKIIGVFIFFSTSTGDAWLLELTDKDAVLVAKNGIKIDVEIEESAETIEVNWSHRFEIKNRKFTTTAYADETEESYEDYPSPTINDALKKIQRNFSSQLLESIHVDSES